jgi:hypothetical protein
MKRRKPPKKWFYRAVKAVKRYMPDIKEPARFVSWLWYHRLKPATRRAAMAGPLKVDINIDSHNAGALAKQFQKFSEKCMGGKKIRGLKMAGNVYTAYDGNFYHVWESNFPSQTGVIRTPYSQDAFNHKKYKTEREAKGDINKRIKLQKKFSGKCAGGAMKKRKHKKTRRAVAGKARKGKARSKRGPVQIIINERGYGMGKKRGKKRGRRMHGEAGFEGRKRGRRRGRFMGGKVSTRSIIGNAGNALAGVAGAVGGAMLGNAIPAKDARIKAAVPLVAGIVLSGMISNPLFRSILIGVSIGGGLSLVRQLAPQIPMLAGADDTVLLLPERPAGETVEIGQPQYGGSTVSLSDGSQDEGAQGDEVGYVTQADY